ncbi:MAG: hypothetical protein WBE20_02280 [Candidatus Acidiferrales bacterium]
MTAERMADWSLWIAGAAFIGCVFVAMACMGVMGVAAKGLKVMLPWEAIAGIEMYKRRFPKSLVYRIFSVSAVGTAVFAGLGLVVVLCLEFGAK